MSNLKQIALGFMMYKQDYDEHYPGSFSPIQPDGTYLTYFTAVTPYIKSTQVWQCPSQSVSNAMPSIFALNGWTTSDKRINYYYNYSFGGNGAPALNVSDAVVSSPSDVFMLWDMQPTYELSSFVGTYGRDAVRPGVVSNAGATITGTGLHLQGENYAFADGHVKWLARTSVPYVSATNQDPRFTIH